ncbi:MAG: hypothetical protein KF785_13350 [Gemmatimonadales bacterium]|nr:hypothetical protein [Gemmatimonadales bacterium]
MRKPFEPVQWPAYLPPFVRDAVQFDHAGRLWVHRTSQPGTPETFDVFDGQGALVERVLAPPRTRIVGFGRLHVYLARLDPDHQEFLERYRL